MKVCNGNELLINLYIDGELPENEARALEAHMRECPACRQYCDEICMVNRAVQDLEPPKDLHASIMAAIAAAQEAETVIPFPASDDTEARSGHKKRHHWLRTGRPGCMPLQSWRPFPQPRYSRGRRPPSLLHVLHRS